MLGFEEIVQQVAQPRVKTVIAGSSDRPLVIGDIEIPCYVLEGETRVLSQRGLQTCVGMSTGGSKQIGAQRIVLFLEYLAKKGIENKGLIARAKSPVPFILPRRGGRAAFGYEATILADICDVILTARRAKVLKANQLRVAERCEVLMRGFAHVGIIGLVDEATGYEKIKNERALAVIFEKFIAKELQSWTKTFPSEFYEQIYRLKGWDGPFGTDRPALIGTLTNNLVYKRVAPGVLTELQQCNPTLPNGRRQHRHHQWLTGNWGHPKLKEHLAAVIALMRAAHDWDSFYKDSLPRAFPILNETIPLGLRVPPPQGGVAVNQSSQSSGRN